MIGVEMVLIWKAKTQAFSDYFGVFV